MKLAACVLQTQPWRGHLQVTQPAAVPPKEEHAGALFPLFPIVTTMAPVINSRNCNIWCCLQCLACLLKGELEKCNNQAFLSIISIRYWWPSICGFGWGHMCDTTPALPREERKHSSFLPISCCHFNQLREALIPSTGSILFNTIQSCGRGFTNHKLNVWHRLTPHLISDRWGYKGILDLSGLEDKARALQLPTHSCWSSAFRD